MLKKIVIAPDSFKGTMSSLEVCDIMEKAINKILPDTRVVKIPIADGGEGTVDAFLTAIGGQRISCRVKGPLLEEVDSFYGILPDGTTAVIEMAAASGLPLVGDDRNPWIATTYGTGELIRDAITRGCRKIIIGIGGSATNDGGAGMAAALGVRFLDAAGNPIPLGGGGLALLARIDMSGRLPALEDCEILAACDVNNPLHGPTGAAFIFGPQKGADEPMVRLLDKHLEHFAAIVKKDLGLDVQEIPGAGAAGGLGAGLVAFAGAKLKPGIQIVLDTVDFDHVIRDADLIFTGEGKMDGQSLFGKVPMGIAERAQAFNVPVVAVVGDVGEGIEKVYQIGISAVFSINRLAIPFKEAKLRCRTDLRDTVTDILRLLKTQI